MKAAIRKAIGAHGMWKQRLREVVSTGRSDFNVASVAKDNNCEFGKWLYGDAKLKTLYAKRFETVRKLHADFHTEVSKILEMALKGQKDKALSAIGENTAFARISTQLTMEMMDWANEAQ